MMLVLAGGLAAPQVLADAPVLILGDSLSAGYGISRDASWPSLLAVRLEQEGYRQSVVNASISGETTAGGFASARRHRARRERRSTRRRRERNPA